MHPFQLLPSLANETAPTSNAPFWWGAVIIGLGMLGQAAAAVWKGIREDRAKVVAKEEAAAKADAERKQRHEVAETERMKQLEDAATARATALAARVEELEAIVAAKEAEHRATLERFWRETVERERALRTTVSTVEEIPGTLRDLTAAVLQHQLGDGRAEVAPPKRGGR